MAKIIGKMVLVGRPKRLIGRFSATMFFVWLPNSYVLCAGFCYHWAANIYHQYCNTHVR